jgi:hypothetical protein
MEFGWRWTPVREITRSEEFMSGSLAAVIGPSRRNRTQFGNAR